MRKFVLGLLLSVMLLFGSFGAPLLSTVEQPVAVENVTERIIGPVTNEASAGATNCTMWGSVYKGSGRGYGVIQSQCYWLPQASVNINICLKNLTTGADMGCRWYGDISTSGTYYHSNYATSWSSIQMSVTWCQYYWGGKHSCSYGYWYG